MNTSSKLTSQTWIDINFVWHLVLILFGALVLGALQYHYWYGESGAIALNKLKQELARQQKMNDEQQRLNTVLMADIDDLKSKGENIEEHARLNLGFIKSGESFVQLSTATPAQSVNQNIIGTDNTPATETVVEVDDEADARP